MVDFQESMSKVNKLCDNDVGIVHLHVDRWRCVRGNVCPTRKQSQWGHENGTNVGF